MKDEMKDVTKLLVTHDMNSIANMADRVILLDKGEIIKEGKPLDVIEDYLKRMHTSLFGTETSQEVVKHKKYGVAQESFKGKEWVKVENDDTGGAMEVKIRHCQMLVNGQLSDVVKFRDEIKIRLIVESGKECKNLIIGYTFKDKYGNSIFAQNTLGANIRIENVHKDHLYIASMYFRWPEIKEGDYFLTLGIGEGEDQMVHKIQCWAHNIIHVEALALRPMHGIINHTIDQFEFKLIDNYQ